MKFYVKVDDEFYNNFYSEESAKEYCDKFLNQDDVNYVEYGVVNYNGWRGLSTIAVLKSKGSD